MYFRKELPGFPLVFATMPEFRNSPFSNSTLTIGTIVTCGHPCLRRDQRYRQGPPRRLSHPCHSNFAMLSGQLGIGVQARP